MRSLVKSSDQSHNNNLKKNPALLWHCRLGHCSKTYLKKAAKYIPELKQINFDLFGGCPTFICAKAVKKPSLTTRYRFSVPLSLVHTDVIGPISPCTFKYGNKYTITFLDDSTHYCWCFPMANKKSVHLAIMKILDEIRKLKGQDTKIRAFRLDNGTEYLTKDKNKLIYKEKINLESIPPYSKFEWSGRAFKFGFRAYGALF